ncbi:DUF6258 family protein [Diaphorobacter aerolatus]|uniref:Uncharacterized protein n=1 Tax=Diaphorobacter aerolatus TaxID=1288495 RepID=A0A7H0GGF2_9BURK|nr:DUF6258 family protein [Diaphorobacter aerolatus]QNP47368.1 hypothetical protein H9K75_13580 [Diaphorobacter aerolatus]
MILNQNQKIYLGDRAIQKIIFETMKNTITIVFDCLSIFETENWIPGESKDIENCAVKFMNVTDYEISPKGMMPNDYIVNINISNSFVKITTLGEVYNEKTLALDIVEGFISIKFESYSINS